MDRLAIHTMTTKPWSLQQAVSHYADRGVGGISVWVEAIEAMSPSTARQMIDDAGLKVPALVRGGFFCDDAASVRQTRIDHNRELIQTAATIGAEMLVLVVGATPRVDLSRQRGWVREGIEQLVGDATAAGVKLAIEPLHPMYAGDKSCINRLAQAREICHSIDDKIVGVAIDVYHVWWDPDLQTEIEMLGRANQIFGFTFAIGVFPLAICSPTAPSWVTAASTLPEFVKWSNRPGLMVGTRSRFFQTNIGQKIKANSWTRSSPDTKIVDSAATPGDWPPIESVHPAARFNREPPTTPASHRTTTARSRRRTSTTAPPGGGPISSALHHAGSRQRRTQTTSPQQKSTRSRAS